MGKTLYFMQRHIKKTHHRLHFLCIPGMELLQIQQIMHSM